MATSSGDKAGLSHLLYRNGFVVSGTKPAIPSISHWETTALGNAFVTTHPEANIRIAASGGLHLALIGMAFDPEEGVYDEGAVLNELLRTATADHDLYAVLDRLAGRFALIVSRQGRTEIFQDAMGSRSVFYSAASGTFVAASHSELVADLVGARFADFFIPFITSKNYLQRDVKYLPGVATAYEGVLQLTPNTKLIMPEQRVERFWPREDIGAPTSDDEATEALVIHLEGLARYVDSQGMRPIVGLTAGTDSRGMFAATKDSDPLIFTYVRSAKGNETGSLDARMAAEIAGVYGLDAHVWPVVSKSSLNATDNDFSHAFRRSTGYYRGAGSAWLGSMAENIADVRNPLFIRGFGGEVMRGFYQGMGKSIRKISVFQLADTYDVNAGAAVTRRHFNDMMERVSFNSESLHGYDANDIFYWEHRMGTWGSTAMAEADLVAPSIVAYNSRNLFRTFMSLPQSVRTSRSAFSRATLKLAPALNKLAT